jgi:hypothetical protein
MQGGGGLHGRVAPPIGATAAEAEPALRRGFAVVTTDSGHQSEAVFDASFMRDQQAALDFAYMAAGRVATLAKEIVARHYGRPPDRSYFAACSTGGREGMLMAQRYPTFFDGIVSGAPAKGHCGGGSAALDRFDLLSAVVDWVEKGTPPDAVPATGGALPGRSWPLCPYPQHAHYRGDGDAQDARSFECRD